MTLVYFCRLAHHIDVDRGFIVIKLQRGVVNGHVTLPPITEASHNPTAHQAVQS